MADEPKLLEAAVEIAGPPMTYKIANSITALLRPELKRLYPGYRVVGVWVGEGTGTFGLRIDMGREPRAITTREMVDLVDRWVQEQESCTGEEAVAELRRLFKLRQLDRETTRRLDGVV